MNFSLARYCASRQDQKQEPRGVGLGVATAEMRLRLEPVAEHSAAEVFLELHIVREGRAAYDNPAWDHAIAGDVVELDMEILAAQHPALTQAHLGATAYRPADHILAEPVGHIGRIKRVDEIGGGDQRRECRPAGHARIP